MRRLAILLAAPLTVVTACAGSSGAAPLSPVGHSVSALSSAGAAARFTNWPTYHRTNSRAGRAAAAITGRLRPAWTSRLDGAVYGEPLVVNGTLIAATENDSVYGLDPRTGRQRWHTTLGTAEPQSDHQCGDIDPLGITGTPAYDATTGSVFVVAETLGGTHTLWALSAASGHRRWHRPLDVLPGRDRRMEQQRAALLVANRRVIVAFGGLDGDCGNYVGYLTSASTRGTGAITHYAVPTPREAGIWATAGPIVGPNGNVYVSVGNGARTSGAWDRSDSVTELRPKSLHVVSAFAPASWRQDNATDADLGSASPLSAAGRIVIAGKTGTVYLLPQNLGGVGHDIATIGGCHAFGGGARVARTVLLPCKQEGIRALAVGRRSLKWRWTANGVYGCPVVAGTKVYVADANDDSLKVLSLADGRVLVSRPAGAPLTHFPSVVVDGNHVFVPTMTGITAYRGS